MTQKKADSGSPWGQAGVLLWPRHRALTRGLADTGATWLGEAFLKPGPWRPFLGLRPLGGCGGRGHAGRTLTLRLKWPPAHRTEDNGGQTPTESQSSALRPPPGFHSLRSAPECPLLGGGRLLLTGKHLRLGDHRGHVLGPCHAALS